MSPQDYITELFASGIVQDQEGNNYPLEFCVDQREGKFITQIISNDPSIKNVIEIGCAYGVSSLFISSALQERSATKHIIIDPQQTERWKSIGITQLKNAGLSEYQLFVEPSELVLPRLLSEGEGIYDFVFIDGFHTFDHTLLDLFFANRLLRVGGYIVIDDCHYSSVAKAVAYILNYPSYKLFDEAPRNKNIARRTGNFIKALIPPKIAGHIIPRTIYDKYYIRTIFSNMIAIQKIAEDERKWDWFETF